VKGAKNGPTDIREIRVDRNPRSGFVVVIKESSGTFDVWLETAEEVQGFLSTLEVSWDD
jgi:hypothetical protein